jgi:hypothetical protein
LHALNAASGGLRCGALGGCGRSSAKTLLAQIDMAQTKNKWFPLTTRMLCSLANVCGFARAQQRASLVCEEQPA